MSTAGGAPPRSIDDYLGPSQGRFFGQGYKRIDQRLTDLEIGEWAGFGGIAALGTISYPGDWSRKDSALLRPHVSSIDGLVMAVQLAEAYLAHAHGLSSEARRQMWLRGYELRAGVSPQEDLAAFPVRAVETSCVPAPSGPGRYVSRFACVVGTMKVSCDIEHCAPAAPVAAARYATADDVLGPSAARYWGDRYKSRDYRIENVAVAHGCGSVSAEFAVVPEPSGGQADPGFAGAHQPSLTMVDCFLSLAQVVQVLAYGFDGLQRVNTQNMWMRRVRMTAAEPRHRISAPIPVVIHLKRSALIEHIGGTWRALEMTCAFDGIAGRASMAHRLPVNHSRVRALGARSA